MNDGRETYVQFDIFLFPFVILLNIIFEISINPSLTLYKNFTVFIWWNQLIQKIESCKLLKQKHPFARPSTFAATSVSRYAPTAVSIDLNSLQRKSTPINGMLWISLRNRTILTFIGYSFVVRIHIRTSLRSYGCGNCDRHFSLKKAPCKYRVLKFCK